MLRKLRWILLLLFLLILVVLGVVIHRSKSDAWPVKTDRTSYPLLTLPEEETVQLRCVLMLDKLNRNTDQVGEIIILRKAPCVYQLPDGKQETINVPLAFFNPTLDAFYWVGGAVTTGLGMPGDPYIDDRITNKFTIFGNRPTVGLWSESAKSTEVSEIITFFNTTRKSLPLDWARQFAASGNKAILPTTESGDKIFLANSFVFSH